MHLDTNRFTLKLQPPSPIEQTIVLIHINLQFRHCRIIIHTNLPVMPFLHHHHQPVLNSHRLPRSMHPHRTIVLVPTRVNYLLYHPVPIHTNSHIIHRIIRNLFLQKPLLILHHYRNPIMMIYSDSMGTSKTCSEKQITLYLILKISQSDWARSKYHWKIKMRGSV